MSNLVTCLNQTIIFESYVVWCGSKNERKHTHTQMFFLERDWILCSTYDNYSKLNNQHNWERGEGNLYDYLMSMIIFTLTMNNISIRDPKFVMKVAKGHFTHESESL